MGLYDRVFARVYDPFMSAAEERLFPPHREYITGVSGEVLDIGSGTGANFPYFAGREDVRLHAVEPDPHMASQARVKAAELGLVDEIGDREAVEDWMSTSERSVRRRSPTTTTAWTPSSPASSSVPSRTPTPPLRKSPAC